MPSGTRGTGQDTGLRAGAAPHRRPQPILGGAEPPGVQGKAPPPAAAAPPKFGTGSRPRQHCCAGRWLLLSSSPPHSPSYSTLPWSAQRDTHSPPRHWSCPCSPASVPELPAPSAPSRHPVLCQQITPWLLPMGAPTCTATHHSTGCQTDGRGARCSLELRSLQTTDFAEAAWVFFSQSR